jgi:TRAP-type C4-dicarboxylate transport system substrate-binding protein
MAALCPRSVARLPTLATGLGLLLAGNCSLAAEELTLKSAVFVPPSTTYGIPFKRFVDRVNETGKGVLQIRIVGGPEAVPADGQAQAVRNGVLDLAAIPPAYYKSALVEGDAQILSDMTLAEQRKSGAYAALSAIAAERMNAIYLTTYGIGVPFHFYVSKDMTITKPGDLSGLRFRGQPNYNALSRHPRSTPRSSAALYRAMAGRFGASTTSAGKSSRKSGSTRGSTTS